MTTEDPADLAQRWRQAENRAMRLAPVPTRRRVQAAAVVAVLVALLGVVVLGFLAWAIAVGSGVPDSARTRGVVGAGVQLVGLLLLVGAGFRAYRTASGRGWREVVAPLTRAQRREAYRAVRRCQALEGSAATVVRVIAARQADDTFAHALVGALLLSNLGIVLQSQTGLNALLSVIALVVVSTVGGVVLSRGRRARRFLDVHPGTFAG